MITEDTFYHAVSPKCTFIEVGITLLPYSVHVKHNCNPQMMCCTLFNADSEMCLIVMCVYIVMCV